jgi:hypothetical protein
VTRLGSAPSCCKAFICSADWGRAELSDNRGRGGHRHVLRGRVDVPVLLAHRSSNGACDNGASGALLLGSLATYSFASPVIHRAHGHLGKAGASFGIRAAPWLIAVPLSQTKSSGAAGLLITSVFMAMVIDDGLLAREPVSEPSVQLGAVVDPETGGAVIAIGRRF